MRHIDLTLHLHLCLMAVRGCDLLRLPRMIDRQDHALEVGITSVLIVVRWLCHTRALIGGGLGT